MSCKCYHAERNFLGNTGVCWGTKECEACSCDGDESRCDFYEYIRERAQKRNALLKSQPRWIPVTERLPEDGADVLGYHLQDADRRRFVAANYDKGYWQDCVTGQLYRAEDGFVTHWMPLPEPPKESI